MKYIIGSIIIIIAALFSHILYTVNGHNFYITFIGGGISMLLFSFIIDYKKQKGKI